MAAASRIGLSRPERWESSAVSAISIGAPGFEPGTSATQRRRATRLRYAPVAASLTTAPEGNRIQACDGAHGRACRRADA